jgi:hypothetical protein
LVKRASSAEAGSSALLAGSTDVNPYDAEELIGARGEREVVSWNAAGRLGRVLVLPDGRYLCPTCRAHSLTFEPGGLSFD